MNATTMLKCLLKRSIVLILIISSLSAPAQRVVFNQKRFSAVIANSAVRSSAEAAHNNNLGNIKEKIDDININASSLVLAQEMIYTGLSQVNSALKNGIALKNIATLTAGILQHLEQAMQLAKNDPALLLMTGKMQSECRLRAVALANDVSGFILKSGDNMLADYNARDELLKKVVDQLHIINALAYGAWRAMFWAKQNGIIATINPFQDYINQDRHLAGQIIRNAKFLK